MPFMTGNFSPKSARNYFCNWIRYLLKLAKLELASTNLHPLRYSCYKRLISNSIGQQRAWMYYAVFDEELRR